MLFRSLALATPVATLVGLGLGASRGILFKEAAKLETMAKVDTLVMDKRSDEGRVGKEGRWRGER